MDDQLRFLLWLAKRLESAEIPYMVTGSLALAAYATPRMTRDVDVVVELHEADVPRVVELFEEDCYVDAEAVAAAVAGRSMFNIIHSDWIVKADFVVRGAEPYRVEEFGRRHTISIEGVPVSFVRAEDLVLSKLLWKCETRWNGSAMSDTSPEVERLYRDRFRRVGAEARVRMATGMFSAARALVRAEASSRDPSKRIDRLLLLERFYARDLAPETLQAVRDHLTADHASDSHRNA